MKKSIFFLLSIVLFFASCDNGSVPSPVVVPEDGAGTNPGGDTGGDAGTGIIQLSLVNQNSAVLYDGKNFIVWQDIDVSYAGDRMFTYGDLLFTLDEFGDIVSTDQLVITPDHSIVTSTDTWLIENIPPADALAAGALYRDYTRIYLNNVETGTWYLQEWKSDNLILTFSEDIIAVEDAGTMHHINGTATNIFHADDLFIYDFNAVAKTAKLKYDVIYDISWTVNYMTSAHYWIEADGVFYSNNGYSWTSAGLMENVNKLWDFNFSPYGTIIPNGQYAYVIDAGTRYENSETVIYWLECNTGWLFRYVPSVNKLDIKYRLYFGDGQRSTGIAYSKTVKPVIIDNNLYYVESGTVWKMDLDTGNVKSFYAGDFQVVKW